MSVEQQIAINADEPEQYTAKQILELMIELDDYVQFSQRVSYNLDEISFKICTQDLEQAALDSILDNPNAIKELYIKTIQSLME